MDTTMQSPIRWKIPLPYSAETETLEVISAEDSSVEKPSVDITMPSGPHTYFNKTWVGRISDGITPRQAFDALSRHATPSQGGVPSVNGGTVDIPVFGKVRQIVDPDRMTIVNTTEPDHILSPGNVHRSIVQDGDDLYVVTRGYGTGVFPPLNERIAPHVWAYEDRNIRREINALPQYTPDLEYSPSSYSYENPSQSSAATTQLATASNRARVGMDSASSNPVSRQSLFTQLMSTGPASHSDPLFAPANAGQAAALLWPSQASNASQASPPLQGGESPAANDNRPQRILGRRTYNLSDPSPLSQRSSLATEQIPTDGPLSIDEAYEYLRRLNAGLA